MKLDNNHLKTFEGTIKIFNNFFDCVRRDNNCPGQKAREAELIMHRCSSNPSIYDCKHHPEFRKKTDVEKTYDLNCL